jgi:hypothetical protein
MLNPLVVGGTEPKTVPAVLSYLSHSPSNPSGNWATTNEVLKTKWQAD